jgi:hypothetical protein
LFTAGVGHPQQREYGSSRFKVEGFGLAGCCRPRLYFFGNSARLVTEMAKECRRAAPDLDVLSELRPGGYALRVVGVGQFNRAPVERHHPSAYHRTLSGGEAKGLCDFGWRNLGGYLYEVLSSARSGFLCPGVYLAGRAR